MTWDLNWAWSLPLIVTSIGIHALGLGYVAKVLRRTAAKPSRSQTALRFSRELGLATLAATLLLAIHSIAWAALYLTVGAVHDAPTAMLYSLSALTSYGHAELFLDKRWQLMGALEAVNGSLLFGLTTAFLFVVIQAFWPSNRA